MGLRSARPNHRQNRRGLQLHGAGGAVRRVALLVHPAGTGDVPLRARRDFLLAEHAGLPAAEVDHVEAGGVARAQLPHARHRCQQRPRRRRLQLGKHGSAGRVADAEPGQPRLRRRVRALRGGWHHGLLLRSKFGRVNASSCGFPVGAGQEMACSASQGAKIVSAVAAPLTTNILGGSASSAVNISCPFTTPEANNCPCTHNGSATEDALIALEFSSPDTGDNSVWCYSSQGEDLCSLLGHSLIAAADSSFERAAW